MIRKSQSKTTSESNKCLQHPEILPENCVREKLTGESSEGSNQLEVLPSRITTTSDVNVTEESCNSLNQLTIPTIGDAQLYLTTVNHTGPSHRTILRSIGNVDNGRGRLIISILSISLLT